MKPTAILSHEHKVVLLALDGAERLHEAVVKNQLDEAGLKDLIDFCRDFVDLCHHAKEEKHLFPLMQERSPETRAPIEVMLSEHEQGRQKVRTMRDFLDSDSSGEADLSSLADTIQSYAQLLRSHIDKEDNILFPMADKVLNDQDNEKLIAAFERIEALEMGDGTHERYHRLAHELAGR